jgi:hypothetical protein
LVKKSDTPHTIRQQNQINSSVASMRGSDIGVPHPV